MDSEQLAGKVAIVTGGGSGMGEASARAMATHGASVLVTDLNDSADRVANEINSAGGRAIPLRVDVTRPEDVQRMVDTTLDEFDSIDILACIAGVLQPTTVEEISEREWQQVLDVNLSGVFRCSRAVLPVMKRNQSGKILIMGSMAGRATSTLGGAHYTASKAGVLGFMRHLARETAPWGLNVNAINPGIIDTPMIHETNDDESLAKVIRNIPFGRLGTTEEVAELVVFLASDRASYITGAAIDIHGGEVII